MRSRALLGLLVVAGSCGQGEDGALAAFRRGIETGTGLSGADADRVVEIGFAQYQESAPLRLALALDRATMLGRFQAGVVRVDDATVLRLHDLRARAARSAPGAALVLWRGGRSGPIFEAMLARSPDDVRSYFDAVADPAELVRTFPDRIRRIAAADSSGRLARALDASEGAADAEAALATRVLLDGVDALPPAERAMAIRSWLLFTRGPL